MKLSSSESDPTGAVLDVVRPLYAEIYSEEPYCEGPADVADFADQWSTRASQPGFRVVIAQDQSNAAIGFTFGHQLSTDTRWWNGLLDHANDDVIAEWPGRSFVIIEMAVRAHNRRQGVGDELHTALLSARPEQRVALLCRPEATAARAAYDRWGYHPIGRLQPFPNGPVYIAMIRNLPI